MNLPQNIEDYLQKTLGMEQSVSLKNTIAIAIRRLMSQEKISYLSDYARLFQVSQEQKQRLIDEIVVGETWFFRDQGPFDYLVRHAARHSQNLSPAGGFAVLSAPCATGEEPYSIVMALFQAGLPPGAFCVDAVDVSSKALEIARTAFYEKNSFRSPIAKNYEIYFQEKEKGKQVTQQVMSQVRFMAGNLILPDFAQGRGPYHVIFCRNILIYLTEKARRQVFQSLDRLLAPGGILFSGHSEAVFWQRNGYLPVSGERVFGLFKPHSTVSLAAKTSSPSIVAASPQFNSSLSNQQAVVQTAGNESAGRFAAEEKNKVAGDASQCQSDRLREARQLADKGELEQALRLCREHAGKEGPSADAYCLKGTILEAVNELERAEGCFFKAIYLNPLHYESLIHVSLLLQRRGDERRAALYRNRAKRQKEGRDES